ncbi:MAG: DEAD/DEAH box helicase, partial [Nitrospirae bacterium]|nr:DEAD/DEAH box helicase [Nitrospirota bacterium]
MPGILVSPHHRLYLKGEDLDQFKELESAFRRSSGHGLLYLDIAEGEFSEEYSFAYWKDFSRLYLSLFSATPNLDRHDLNQDPIEIELPREDLERFLLTVPPIKGAEYVDQECLLTLWRELEAALRIEIKEFGKDIASFFSSRHSGWNLLGRVCFHLAENKNSEERPFAFLATYANQVSRDGRSQHLPLSRALEDYSGEKQKNILLRLLAPIQKASQESGFLKERVDSGELFHTLAWTAAETYQFLKDIPLFEKAGVVVKVPNWWRSKQPGRPQIAVRLGEKQAQGIGFDALIDFSMSVVLGEEQLSEKEIQELLERSEHLVFFKGQWVEVDQEKLKDLLTKWRTVAKQVKDGGVTFAEGLRWLSGMDGVGSILEGPQDSPVLTRIISGKWLQEMLDQMKRPEASREIDQILSKNLKTRLRPYQNQGVTWLNLLHHLRLGAILADDMGLGKTVQVISLLLLKQGKQKAEDPATLLIVPASLIGNWKSEIDRFAPSLKYWIAHPSADGTRKPVRFDPDLFITTYGSVARLPWLSEQNWGLVILDEAQAIKNPAAKQTRALKTLKSSHRLALTGTPVENHLSDLWSLFDFVSPGLLGSSKEFESFIKRGNGSGESPYASLRSLVSPYILRRLKTDKSIISDLPDKTEIKTYCPLSKAQVALYQKSVESLAREIQNSEGIKRRGIILSYLMRFKQICNHPSQFVKTSGFPEGESGKFLRLRELCEVIFEKQEKVLVFTQFKEMTEPLSRFLESLFHRPGLVLHGGIQVKKRMELVDKFQRDDGPPFFILSLKAGGTGLNLTEASHVIHFDRWWNPAVENQATDRAFRIGQKRKVLVHKFICKGTLEEKIDAMIESKVSLSREILEGGE